MNGPTQVNEDVAITLDGKPTLAVVVYAEEKARDVVTAGMSHRIQCVDSELTRVTRCYAPGRFSRSWFIIPERGELHTTADGVFYSAAHVNAILERIRRSVDECDDVIAITSAIDAERVP